MNRKITYVTTLYFVLLISSYLFYNYWPTDTADNLSIFRSSAFIFGPFFVFAHQASGAIFGNSGSVAIMLLISIFVYSMTAFYFVKRSNFSLFLTCLGVVLWVILGLGLRSN
jgi:Na+-translocating ferredoxin:NAD+ oxidoreductase RnfD subunit